MGIFFAPTISVSAYNGPIKIRRICLDITDSSINLSFSDLSNPCGTFSKIEVYERLNITDPFTLKYSSAVMTTNTISFKQPDFKKRQYFIAFYTQCDGVTVLYSDTVFTDLEPPFAQPMDSVSVDLPSQKVVIGWQQNPSPDYKGYAVFKQTGGNNIKISDQRTEDFTDPNSNPQTGPLSYSFNTYDSCGISSIISSPHVTMFLNAKLNYCERTIDLNWSAYIGWVTSKYYIYTSENGSSYSLTDSTSSPSYKFGNIKDGTNYCFYIRSKKSGSNFTSSSNRVCVSIKPFIYPSNTEIISLAVADELSMRLKWICSQCQEVKAANIFRGKSPSQMVNIGSVSVSEGINYYLDNVSTTEQGYFYQLFLIDSCDRNIGSTTLTESIFVSNLNDKTLLYNPFKFNIGTNQNNTIQLFSSTWNDKSVENANIDSFHLQIDPNDTAICYRVISLNELGDTSISNTICINLPLVFYIPNGLKLSGSGGTGGASKFGVYGTGIDWNKTNISIFNRWGEKLFEINNNQREWNGKYKEDEVLPGVYIYYGVIFGKKKRKQSVSGKIIIIE